MLVVTADHGFVDVRPESRLDAGTVPGFAERLAIRDWIPGDKRFRQVGIYGGVSREEMYVPLVVVPPS